MQVFAVHLQACARLSTAFWQHSSARLVTSNIGLCREGVFAHLCTACRAGECNQPFIFTYAPYTFWYIPSQEKICKLGTGSVSQLCKQAFLYPPGG